MQKDDNITLEEFREALARITADREIFKNMIEAHKREDASTFQDIVRKLELDQPRCIFVCRFICWIECVIRCERICTVFCRW